ncbi:threonine synthase [Azospirillum sp. TSH64]|uniref:threonine synthase n=1 Tax=Azospirillum sp. TSH64 TaxID=652740 RepID=UPI000D61AB85|nr:threonine synthase [Azospirillum sp. TSH64]PWC78195.1 threonine synthase [Azospirillum sp. TSH64]
MRYVSTRGAAPVLGFEDVLLAGLARDGGLYVPETWPQFTADDIRAMRGLPYSEIAVRVMLPFLGGSIAEDEFRAIVRDAYASFDHAAVTPLVQVDPTTWVLELFHGPTLAFKDVALQLLGRLFDHVLAKRGERVTIVGATSGDTGSAAIEACRDRQNVDIFILHPKGRTSEVQRRQMTSVLSSNVHNIALDGTFDDCQDLVKAMFNDGAFRDRMGLSAVNSINWARIMAQIVYYFTAAVALGVPDRKIAFTVPTGNFGNVYAAYGARSMGLPIETLVVGSNSNDILARFFASGSMVAAPVVPTLSPSMDIQISSNFERLLFDLLDRDGTTVTAALNRFRTEGRFAVTDAQLARALAIFSGHRVDEAATMETIAEVWKDSLYLLDPHTAVGIGAAKAAVSAGRADPTVPMVVLATAHPAKFPDAVEKATGRRPDLPPRLSDLYVREERLSDLPNDLAAVQDFVTKRARAAQEAA